MTVEELWKIIIADINRLPETPFLIPYETIDAKGVKRSDFLIAAADLPELLVAARPFGVYVARATVGLRTAPILHYLGQECEIPKCGSTGWHKANQVQGDPTSAILLCDEHFKERMK